MSFYKNYVKLCNQRNKSPSSVAAEIGLERSSASRWARGSAPRFATLVKLADYFNISVMELVGATPETAQSMAQYYGVSVDLLLGEGGESGGVDGENLDEWLEDLRTRPETRALLSASRGMTKEQVEKMANFIAEMKKGWTD